MKLPYKLIFCILLLLVLASGQVQGEYSLSEFVDGLTNFPNITIKVTDRFLSVRGGCNIHTGYFNVSQKSKVSVGPFSSTDLKCAQNYDSLFLRRLASTGSFSVQNGVLSLVDKENKSVAKFKKLSTSDETVDIHAIIA